MASAIPVPDIASTPERHGAGLLVSLAASQSEQLESVVSKLLLSFSADDLIVAAGKDAIATDRFPALRIVEAPATRHSLTITAIDFVNAYQLVQKYDAHAVLILGQDAGSLDAESLMQLANAAMSGATDLAVPCYDLPPHAGLVNSAILYPLTRTLFACDARFPLAIDLGLSLRMAQRLAGAAQRFTAQNQGEALVWPVNEAAISGYVVAEFNVGARAQPQPTESDVNAILSSTIGSLFSDIEAKAAFWQRARQLPRRRTQSPGNAAFSSGADLGPMVDAFRLAYANLQEIWSLVLPPNSMLGLKRLSVTDAAAFRIPDSLWARIVFDFLLAYRLRTINRGHLLGALIPLYLAWVASHINMTATGIGSERHIESVAAAFEADKAYLLARWRWPDRFNP